LSVGLVPAGAGALTLDQAQELAAENRPALAQARAGEAAALAGLSANRAAARPKLEVTVGATRMDDPAQALFATLSQQRLTAADLTPPETLNDPGAITDMFATVRVSQPLFAGGAIRAGVRAGEAGAAAARAARMEVAGATRAQVTRAFYGYLLALEALKVVNQAERTAVAHRDLVQDRVDAGAAVRAELLQAQAHLAHVRGQVIDQQRDLALAEVALSATLGVEALPTMPSGTLPEAAPSLPEREGLVQLALERRPALAAADAALARRRAEHRAARGAYFPQVGLEASAADHRAKLGGDAGQVWQVAAQARWALADGGSRGAGVRAAEAAVDRAEAERRQAVLAVRSQVVGSYMTRQAALQRLGAAKAEVAAVTEGLRLTRDRYQAGAALLTELEDAEDRVARAELARLSAGHDLAVADAELNWATGGALGDK